tara:strand:+ start:106 stop:321 length:216 start_codon:yes stop_codon:yes gene_type:complete
MEGINDPLELEDKLYTIEAFGSIIRKKFGGDNYISDVILGELFLSKYPSYSCKIKKSENYISKKTVAAVRF